MSMKKNTKWIVAAIFGTILVIAGCIKLTDVILPSKIDPGTTVEIHVKGQIKPETGYGPEGLALAILAPKAWDTGMLNPWVKPWAMLMNIQLNQSDAPSAASADMPMPRPTTLASTSVYIC